MTYSKDVFPTQVGVIRHKSQKSRVYESVPHTGGGDPDPVLLSCGISTCSPHRWG